MGWLFRDNVYLVLVEIHNLSLPMCCVIVSFSDREPSSQHHPLFLDRAGDLLSSRGDPTVRVRWEDVHAQRSERDQETARGKEGEMRGKDQEAGGEQTVPGERERKRDRERERRKREKGRDRERGRVQRPHNNDRI